MKEERSLEGTGAHDIPTHAARSCLVARSIVSASSALSDSFAPPECLFPVYDCMRATSVSGRYESARVTPEEASVLSSRVPFAPLENCGGLFWRYE